MFPKVATSEAASAAINILNIDISIGSVIGTSSSSESGSDSGSGSGNTHWFKDPLKA